MMTLRTYTLIFCLLLITARHSQAGVLTETPNVNEPISILKIIDEVKRSYPNSALADTQIEHWLRQLTDQELIKLSQAARPSWDASEFGRLLWSTKAYYHITPHIDKFTNQGRLDGERDWREALKKSKSFTNEKQKLDYLTGLYYSADSLDTYIESAELRSKVLPLLTYSQKHNLTTRLNEITLWPPQPIADYGKTLNENGNFSIIRRVAENAPLFFSDFQLAESYLVNFGSSALGQIPVIADSMGKVIAARDPLYYLKWYKESAQRGAIAIEPLLRNDINLINEITPLFSGSKSYDAMRVAQEWAFYQPQKARQWALKVPAIELFGEDFVFRNIPKATKKELTIKFTELPQSETLSRPQNNGTTQSIKELVALAHPGASAFINTDLYTAVFSLNEQQSRMLFLQLTERPLTNAREVLVRHYLLESWLLHNPEAACDWLLANGDGRMRRLLPLAFRHMKSHELIPTKKRLNKIPESTLYHRCRQIVCPKE